MDESEDFFEEQQPIPEPLAVIPLEDSLELRVEASFSFGFHNNKGECDGIHIYRKQWVGGTDISIYRSDTGELCLSPHYCKGMEERTPKVWCSPIDRTLDRKQLRRVIIPIVSRLTKAMPKELTRVYEIKLAEINPLGFDFNNYRFTKITENNKGESYEHMLIYSKKPCEPELIEGFWNRDRFYPGDLMCGKYVCNDFAVYFLDSKNEWKFKVAFFEYYAKDGANQSQLIELSEAVIGNVVYGYRMSFLSNLLDFSKDDLIELVKLQI